MPPASSPIESLSAVTLVTTDMARSCRFYDAAGFTRNYGGPDAPFSSYHVGASYLNLQLVDGWRPPEAVWGRVIVWVDDVDALHDRIRSAGYVPSTCPADASWGERYFHVSDPDGHELSFARPLEQIRR